MTKLVDDPLQDLINTQKIVYKPHCSKCGAEITDKVTYRKIIRRDPDDMLLPINSMEIYPSRCEHCNQPFLGFEIQPPEQLRTEFY